ncbi:MAG: hypothetical protein LH603_06930 [Pseudonocardia sp.]|nr:hypothetical protein [Pseudonocardia sp.]
MRPPIVPHVEQGLLDAAGALRYPNARYVMARSEWDYWSADPTLAELTSDADGFREPLLATPRAVLPAIKERLDWGASPGWTTEPAGAGRSRRTPSRPRDLGTSLVSAIGTADGWACLWGADRPGRSEGPVRRR